MIAIVFDHCIDANAWHELSKYRMINKADFFTFSNPVEFVFGCPYLSFAALLWRYKSRATRNPMVADLIFVFCETLAVDEIAP